MFGFSKPTPVDIMTPKQAEAGQRKGEICLVDVREAGEWAQMRVPGAIHAPLSTLESRLATLPSGRAIVFYCLSGQRSARAIGLCKSLGLPHQTHIAGGITAWKAAGLPVEK
ncbi:MAG: rhodanese-like domain-containing protein [Hyphomicrobium sp.]|nr:rhodanese-like domain-containing protein [Hyphomicrobium sp.]